MSKLGGLVTKAQAQTVVCPNCNAQPDRPCTQPTDTGRTPVAFAPTTARATSTRAAAPAESATCSAPSAIAAS